MISLMNFSMVNLENSHSFLSLNRILYVICTNIAVQIYKLFSN